VGEEPNHTIAKILFLCKSFNTLCPRRFDALMSVFLYVLKKNGDDQIGHGNAQNVPRAKDRFVHEFVGDFTAAY
jgi:hypothetical protein